MSFSNINIGKKVDNYDMSEVFNSYGRVDIVLGEDDQGNVITVSYPNIADDKVGGRILTIDMPMCTDTTLARTAATRIYNSLMTKDPTAFQYQPHETAGAIVDPSIEFGDSIDVNGVHSGFHFRATMFGRLMKNNLSSPSDEEINHEYPYEDSKQRQITRTNKEFKASLYITNQAITAEVSRASAAEGQLSTRITVTANGLASEVSRATAAEGNLSSRITQTASEINASVSRERSDRINADNAKLDHTNNSQSFGWSLTSTAFSLKNNNTEVFRFDANGLKFKSNGADVFTVTRTGGLYVKGNGEFSGKITASSGSIGGFTIDTNKLYNNISVYGGSQNTGVYIGTDGIQLGQRFKVDNQGNIDATSMKLRGTLTFYNSDGTSAGTLTAADLRKGAQAGYDWDNEYYGETGQTYADYALGGAGGGYGFSYATQSGTDSYPNLFTCGRLIAKSGFTLGSYDGGWESITFKDGNGRSRTVTFMTGRRA